MVILAPEHASSRTLLNGENGMLCCYILPKHGSFLFRSVLTKDEKLNYIEAIKCIHSKPALTPSAVASGARSRYDDFVVTHVLQTYSVHATVRPPAQPTW